MGGRGYLGLAPHHCGRIRGFLVSLATHAAWLVKPEPPFGRHSVCLHSTARLTGSILTMPSRVSVGERRCDPIRRMRDRQYLSPVLLLSWIFVSAFSLFAIPRVFGGFYFLSISSRDWRFGLDVPKHQGRNMGKAMDSICISVNFRSQSNISHRSTTYHLNEIRKRFCFLISARLVYKGRVQFAFFLPFSCQLRQAEKPKKNSRLGSSPVCTRRGSVWVGNRTRLNHRLARPVAKRSTRCRTSHLCPTDNTLSFVKTVTHIRGWEERAEGEACMVLASAVSWRSLIRHDDDGCDFLLHDEPVVVRSP